jgi:hypothetical protein
MTIPRVLPCEQTLDAHLLGTIPYDGAESQLRLFRVLDIASYCCTAGMGFSHHRVPSLSNTAIRSSLGMWFGPSPVTDSTRREHLRECVQEHGPPNRSRASDGAWVIEPRRRC